MKNTMLALFGLIFSTFGSSSAFAAEPNGIRAHLHNIQDLVRSCSILPYTFRNGVRVYHHLISHCPEVHVLPKGHAKMKIGGHVYEMNLAEAIDSDGDIFHIRIRDTLNNEVYTLKNVPAYGDILLGILDGNSKGVPMKYVSGSAVEKLDKYDHR